MKNVVNHQFRFENHQPCQQPCHLCGNTIQGTDEDSFIFELGPFCEICFDSIINIKENLLFSELKDKLNYRVENTSSLKT